MIALVYCHADICRSDAVPDDLYHRGAVKQRFRNVSSGSLSHRADERRSRYEHLPAIRQTVYPFLCDSDTLVSRMTDSPLALKLLQKYGPVPDIGIRRKRIPHFHQMNLFAVSGQMNRTLTARQSSSQHNQFPALYLSSFLFLSSRYVPAY